jgi:hypothetical protein
VVVGFVVRDRTGEESVPNGAARGVSNVYRYVRHSAISGIITHWWVPVVVVVVAVVGPVPTTPLSTERRFLKRPMLCDLVQASVYEYECERGLESVKDIQLVELPLLFSRSLPYIHAGALLSSCGVATKDLGFTGPQQHPLRHLHSSPPHPTRKKNLGLSLFLLSPGISTKRERI